METALNGPPPVLERVVLLLIPPAAREAMAGDLWERYRSPQQYALEALAALPFVIASQARRNGNLPVVALQGILAFGCFGGFTTSFNSVIPTLAILAALLLQPAYQGLKPPSAPRAAMETILVAGAILIISFAHGSLLRTGTALGSGLWPLVVAGSFPILSLFRTQLSLAHEEQGLFANRDMTADDIRSGYGRFARDTAKRNCMAAGALLMAAAAAVPICRSLSPILDATGWSFAGIYIAGGAYLLLVGAARRLPAGADFLSLRAVYGRELARQNQLRCFMWWLWLTPLLSEIYIHLIERGWAAGQTVLPVRGIQAAIFLCFLVVTINSERSGRIRENIAFLAQMHERKTI
jgi:hypothetical protein